MAEERTSNYIKLCDEWAEKFLQMEKKGIDESASGIEGRGWLSEKSHILVCHSEFGWTMEELTGWQKWQGCL